MNAARSLLLAAVAFGTSTIVLATRKSKHHFEKNEIVPQTETFTVEVPPSESITTVSQMDEYRLLDSVKPETYDLTLYPNLKDGIFDGAVIATIEVLKDVSEIKIHSNGLTITNVLIDGVPAVYELNEKYEFLTLKHVDNSIIETGKRIISIQYNGDMKNRIVGLYISNYTAADGSKRMGLKIRFKQ
ncbi:hypothetical protein FQR65_LT06100 [Abscondita terminalis]|nr:hypothetical protein FQR65_LT06100 [Abscondita terminalis]